jgi:hypothetical protein
MLDWPELESLMTDGMASQGRQIKLYTGMHGASILQHQLVVENTVGYVQWMMENKKIDSDIGINLINMLRSEDIDNFNIAILAIEQLKNEHSI